jgi:hypothetical protein
MASVAKLGPETKGQHFVHRAYLDGFIDQTTSADTDERLWTYMARKSPFLQRTERLAKRNYYYCLGGKNEPRNFQIESDLAKLEDFTLPILLRLREKNFKMSADDRLTFAGYIALAFARVPVFERSVNREQALKSARNLELFSRDKGALEEAARKQSEETSENVTAEQIRKNLISGSIVIDQESREWSIKMMFERMLKLQQIIWKMNWSFSIAPDRDSGFLTTDNPVALFDPNSASSGIGFTSSPAAHFAFPLGQNVCLIGSHSRAPLTRLLNASKVREVNKNVMTRFDKQVYAPFRSDKVQAIVDSVAQEQKPGKVYFRKGKAVVE